MINSFTFLVRESPMHILIDLRISNDDLTRNQLIAVHLCFFLLLADSPSLEQSLLIFKSFLFLSFLIL